MNKITAKEARDLAGPTIEEHVEYAYELIREAATKKYRSTKLTSDFWVNEGYNRSWCWSKACDLLRAEGFTVDFFYEERQFVDMYTVVKW